MPKKRIGGKVTYFSNAAWASMGYDASNNLSMQITALEEERNKLSLFGEQGKRRRELTEQINALKDAEKPKAEPKPRNTPPIPTPTVTPVGNTVTAEKVEQFEIIQETNPMRDDYHTGIRSPSDIKTAQEAFGNEDDYLYPDFSPKDGARALRTGTVTIYSSNPIRNGGFVSTSKRMAQDYAGSGKVYSKTVSIDDVAWIDANEGQMAIRKKK